MSKYIVVNRHYDTLQLVIPAPHGSGRFSASFNLAPSNAMNILPYGGTLENCKNIMQLVSWKSKGMVEIIEEP